MRKDDVLEDYRPEKAKRRWKEAKGEARPRQMAFGFTK